MSAMRQAADFVGCIAYGEQTVDNAAMNPNDTFRARADPEV